MAKQGMAKGKGCVPLILMEWVQDFCSLGSQFYLTARALQHLPQTAPKDQGYPRAGFPGYQADSCQATAELSWIY